MTIEERVEAMKVRMAKLQRRGVVAKKVTKQEFFGAMVALCPACKGEQFTTYVNEDGDKKDKWCTTCFGSGISPKEESFARSYVWAK